MGIGFDVFEIFAGAAAVGTAGGAVLGGYMIIHGGINVTAKVIKITVTTVAADLFGDDYADKLDKDLPDSMIGLGGYMLGLGVDALMAQFSNYNSYESGNRETLGAIGDWADLGIGLGLSYSSQSKIIKELTKAMNKYGKSGVQKALPHIIKAAERLGKNKLVKWCQTLLEAGNDVNNFIENTNQIHDKKSK